MKYLIEPIGTPFSKNDVARLGERFSEISKEGYRLHSVFQVQQPGCLGIGGGTAACFAVYEQAQYRHEEFVSRIESFDQVHELALNSVTLNGADKAI